MRREKSACFLRFTTTGAIHCVNTRGCYFGKICHYTLYASYMQYSVWTSSQADIAIGSEQKFVAVVVV